MQTVEANFIDKIEIHEYGHGAECVAVVGGIHGNEYKGIEGCRILIRVLDSAFRYPFLLELLQKRKIVVIPCLNPLGNSAGARTCPHVGTLVNLDESGHVVVGSDEKGGIKPPQGWSDPNHGWDANNTIAKAHIQRLVDTYRPKLIVWSHDWAPPQSIVKRYSGVGNPGFDGLGHLEDTLSNYYPSLTIFGKKWPFLVHANESDDSIQMTWSLFEKFNIPSYVVEQYTGSPDGGMVHALIALQLALHETGVNVAELRKSILEAVKSNVPARE